MTHFFTLTPGTDNFTGLAGDYNQFQFTPSTLQSTDTITGGATGSFLDILVATAGGTITSSQFSGVTLVEQLNLSSGGNNVTLSNSLVAGTSVGYFAVVDGGGNDTVDASTITTKPIVFFAGAGSDTFKGGGGNDAVFIAPTNLTSADTLQGGAGIDNLYLNAAGTVSASAFTNVTGFEGLGLSSSGNTVTLTNALVAGASYFAVNDGGGNDSVDASAVTATPIVFFEGAGSDTFTGGGGNDAVYVAVADLTSADTLQGGTGVDNLYLTTAGTVAGSAFTNVTGFESLVLNGLGNNVTLTNSLLAGSNTGVFAVADGAGNDTVDASGVNNGSSLVIFASTGADTFKGGNGLNGYLFAVTDLTSADTVVGGSGVDNLIFNTAGTVAASAFTNVTGIEAIVLANGANNVTLTNGLVAGTSIGYFAVVGGTNNDIVDASGITNGTAIVFNGATGGNDSFTGGNGDDSFQFAAGQLTSADTVVGGGGADVLWMTTAGTTNTADLAGVSGIEGVYLQNGGTFHLANGITAAAGLSATGSAAVDNFDASAVTTYSVSFTGNGGADTLTGGSQNDTFFIADSAFTSINGNGGVDRITLTAPAQSFNLTANAAKITNLEVIDLDSSLNSTLTLAGTDIAQINASGTSLYVVGDAFDTVNAGNGYTQIASGVVNNAVAPGHTFFEYQHSSGSLLFIDSAITSLTATTGTGSASVPEGTAGGATVFNAQQAGATTYVLGGADAALFSIDGTGHISFNASPNFETPLDQGTNNVYDLTVTSSNGTATPNFVETVDITVTDVAPSTPVDSDAATANSVAEGAAAGTYTGVTASSTDVNGPAVSWSLTADSSGGGFTIGADGKINVLDASKINYETATHSYDVTAQASDGAGGTSSHSFTIAVTNTNPSGPTDSDSATANSVVEGASIGTYTGLTASSADVNGPTVTWLLTADSSGGAFAIGADGKVTVIDPSLLDFETTGPGHTYSVTAQASDTDGGTASQSFNITVTNANPSNPADSDTATADTVDEGAAVGTYTGVTAAATDPNGPAVTWTLTGDSSGGGFTIGADGKINVLDASKINYETATHSYDVTAQASDGNGGTSTHVFTISVGDVAPSTPVDSDTVTADSVPQSALVGTYTGVTASSTDVNGPAVTWSLTNDTSGGGFGIDSTGKITVIDSSKIIGPSYTVTAQASDGTLSSHQDFVITVVPNTAPTANADSLSATEKGGVNNATGGSNPTGNVITGTGGATADTDAETPGSLTVVSFGTGGLAGPNNGTVDGATQLTGDHGTLTLGATGTFNYLVNQNDAAVQALVPASAALTDTFHYTIQDPGGLTSIATITVSISGANDLPLAVTDTGVTFTMGEDAGPTSFLVRANDSLDPDTGAANTVAPGAVTVSGTPAGTTIGNADATAAAFNSGQEIRVTLGAAFQQLHAGETATVTVPYTLTGNAGETSTTNLVVTVNGANDVPTAADNTGSMTEDQSGTAFTVLGNDTFDPDHGAPIATTPGAVTVGAITNLSAPGGESIDAADFSISVNATNQVVVTLVGTDVQHMKQGESTTFDVPYTLHGDQAGDLANATLHVTVTGVNDAPTGAQTFTFNAANSAIGNTALVLDDGVGPAAPDPAGPQKTISGSLLTGATDVDGPNALATVAVTNQATTHGHVTISTSGEFSYTPAAGYIGSDSFNYTITDGNTPTAGTVTGSVTINVATPKVWYVSSSTGSDATGDGTSEHPFASLAPLSTGGSADSLDGANDLIFLYNGTYSSGIVLEAGQQLIGQSQGLTVNGTTLEAATAGNATVNGTVTLASGNTIDGITFGNAAGFSLQDSGATVGTATVAHSSINNTTGGAVSIANGGTLAMNFSSISASGTSTSAIALANTTGTFTGSGGTLNNGAAAAADVAITGDHVNDDLNFTYDGAINDSTGTTVAISGQSGGTKDFNGAITGGGIALTTNNAGATVNFDGALSLSTGAAAAFAASGGGTLNVTNAGNSITTSTGTALNLNGITVGTGVAFNSVTTNGAANGILIDTVGQSAGSTGIDINGGSIVNATTRGVDINATSADISIASGISTTAAGRSVEVTGTTGSKTIAFSGAIDDNGLGINLATNTGTTMNFTGGLQIDTGANTGFNATGGGIVNVTGTTNHIATTTGTALNVANTTIGASELNFHDISANGAVNGIVLNTTGSTGGLNVTGNATNARDGSGGTIQNTTGDGVLLTSASQVSLSHMNINSTGGQGVMGSAVNGFVSDWNSFSANGNATKEGAIRFGFETDPNATGLTGGAIGSATETRIDNTLISGSFERGVSIFNNSGTLTQLNVHGTTIQNSTNGSGMLLELRGNAVASTDLQNSTFTGNKAAGFQGVGTAQSNLTVNAIGAGGHTNTFSNNNDGVLIGSTNDADVTTEFSNNTFSGNHPGVAITVSTFQSSTASGSLSAKILNNTVSVPASGLNDAIQALMSGTGTPQHIKIDGNVITDAGTGANGIFVGTPDAGTSPNFTAIITNNTVTMTDTVNSGNGISAQSTKGGTAVFKIEQNTVSGAAIDGIFLFRPNTSTSTVSLERGISASNTASVVLAANNPNAHSAAGGLDTEVLGTITVVNNGTITLPLNAAPGGVAAATPEQAASTGNYHLTQIALDTVVAAAISQWAAAGASASQLAAMHATTFSVEDLAGKTVGDESTGHIAIDVDAAGHGWFVDPTPNDNSEFTHAANAAGTDLYTDPTNAAAGHLDLLTTVSHELGHVVGLDDSTNTADAHDLMFINLVDGERRMPDAADVAEANATSAATIEANLPLSAQAAAGTPIIVGTAANDTIDAGHGGNILFGGAGADHFVFGPSIQLNAPTPAQITHVADYSAAEGDTFDFSALTSAFHNSGVNDSLVVRAVEDASGKFATLQVDHIDPIGMPSAPNWVNVAQLDGAHAGDAVNILIDNNHSVHLAQIHVDLLV